MEIESMENENTETAEVDTYQRWKVPTAEKFASDSEARDFIREAQRGNPSAMERITLANVPMVERFAREFSFRGMEFDDLFQVGQMAITKAISNFKTESKMAVGAAFIMAVRTAMAVAVGRNRMVRIAVNANTNKTKIHAIMERMIAEGKEITAKAISAESGLPEKTVEKLLAVENSVVSMNIKAEGKEGEGDEIGDFIASEVESPYEVMEKADSEKANHKAIAQATAKLSAVERIVIEMRYMREKTATLEEVGKVINRTAQMASVIEKRALAKMRKVMVIA